MKAGLLERKSTGGAVSRGGMEYQDAFVLQHIPLWLSQGSFSHIVSEAIGDIHVCYYGNNRKIIHTVYEAKNHTLTANQFWEEIQRFKEMHDTAPDEFPWFVLVCRDFNSTVTPFVSKLSRIRGVGTAFASDSVIHQDSINEAIEWAVIKEVPSELAEFAVNRVEFRSYADEHADEAFAGELSKCLPSIDISSRVVPALRDRLKDLIKQSSFGTIRRAEIESELLNALSKKEEWIDTPTPINTVQGVTHREQLCIDVSEVNGDRRGDLPPEEWMEFANNAAGIAAFFKESRQRRCIAIDGKQRMSTACVLGHAFGATKSHVLQIEQNGSIYRTDNHTKAAGKFFNATTNNSNNPVAEAIVCIAFPTAIGNDAARSYPDLFNKLPTLILNSERAIEGIAVLNTAVAEAKSSIVNLRASSEWDTIHLFMKVPSFFAMALGHRLNGLGRIQLYDWIGNEYKATALIKTT